MISIFNTIMSHAEDFDGMTFNRITESGHLKNLCNQIKEAGDDHNKVSQLKKKLPAVTWQAYQQRGTNRSAAMCTANGLFIIDVDHIDDPRGLWQRIEKENKHYEKDEIMVAHVTPSGRGLRIVAKRYNTRFTIAECQDIFCSHYNIECGLFEKFSDPSAPHFYDLQYVNKALYEWNERQRHMAIENMSISRDTCRRRAAVVGFRAALLAEAIADVEGVEPDREAITAFATYIADLHLETMLTMFESKIEESMETAKKPTVQQESAFQSLPAEFTRSDLAAALKRLGRTTPVRNVVSCWKSYGMIEVLDRVNIRKL